MRGWGEADFRLVQPDFLALVRHGILAESVAPVVERLEAVQAQDIRGLDPHAKLQAARHKTVANDVLPLLRSLIFPEDTDG